MASTVITITGMTCSRCVNAVQAEIGKLTGVSDVAVDLDTGLVTISGKSAARRGRAGGLAVCEEQAVA